MKRCCKFFGFLLLAALGTATVVFNVAAEDGLFVYPGDGGSAQSTPLNNIRRLTFSGDNLLLKTVAGSEITYSLAGVGKITFEDVTDTGISDLQSKVEIKLYPNPSADFVIIDSSVGIASWTLFDLNGKLLKQSVSELQIRVSDLPAGVYFLKIDTGNGVVTKKIIKE